MILKTLMLGPLQNNCYILTDEQTGESAIFDPANDGEKIVNFIQAQGIKVKYIILTHTHIDHIAALDYVKRYTGAPVAVHKAEADMLNDDEGVMAFILDTHAPQTICDIALSDGDELSLGKSILKVIHTPGHTMGGICVLCGDILISGDTLFNESVGRTDFKGGDYAQLACSIKERLFVLDDDVSVYPGHGPSTTIAHEKQFNPFL